MERGAGRGTRISDEAFAEAGASLSDDPAALLASADLVVKVAPPSATLESGEVEAAVLREGGAVVAMMAPHRNLETVRRLARGKVTTFALELMPRIARAQSMDVLSSQSNIAGYRAVLVAANELPRYFPMLMTAAGTVRPAKVLVVGAGVAGLQAVATARRLGAVVTVSDIRPEVAEQAASLGAEFVDMPQGESGDASQATDDVLAQQREILAGAVAAADVVITAALVPGQAAPRLVTAPMVEGMAGGSVVVDLAGEEGGNCELSSPGEAVDHGDVRVVAPMDLIARQAVDASALFARNVAEFVALLDVDDADRLRVDPDEEILAQCMLTADGAVAHAPTAAALEEGDR
ncbi:MAG: NAD(P)(+) transhydrogenase (Re/Si-specific) subunit alpha [Actinobacteria bacterium QS_8_72_14]|nr:MAG: NAD(P)(+) transhydrogenase (Re/Si-specific) subunit alpha [Actinobacteria bacterium QS_8_72_14]